MLTSSLDIQKCFLIFLNLTKLSPDQKMAQILYPRVPNLLIIIFNINNKIFWLIISSMLSLFSFQALDKLDLDLFYFWLFYIIVYFGVVFDLVFQKYINSRTYACSNSNRSLIELLGVFTSYKEYQGKEFSEY